MMEANNDSAIQFELRSESLQEQLDAAKRSAEEAWDQVHAIAVRGLGLPDPDLSATVPSEWDKTETLSDRVLALREGKEAAERKLATVTAIAIKAIANLSHTARCPTGQNGNSEQCVCGIGEIAKALA